ncbi:hypothetical protein C5S36_15670, partial [Candidatus Methanophagaceae archaeon]
MRETGFVFSIPKELQENTPLLQSLLELMVLTLKV